MAADEKRIVTMGEEDSFGPLSRMCAAKDPNGAEVRFYYG